MSIPTLDELLERINKLYTVESLRGYEEVFETHFRLVASGQAAPLLRDTNAQFAAQCVCVLLEHLKRNPVNNVADEQSATQGKDATE